MVNIVKPAESEQALIDMTRSAEEILEKLEKSKNLVEFLDKFNLYKKKYGKNIRSPKMGSYSKIRIRLE